MKLSGLILLAALLGLSNVHAQWTTKSYSLVSGWNGIWLAGDASHTTVADIFAAYPNVSEVWRWNPNPDQIQFTQTPSEPTTASEEWTVWKRDDPAEQILTQMLGNSAYLIKCANTTSVSIKQLVKPPVATWLVSGANFIGFPSAGTGGSGPTLSSYLGTYPSASTTVLAPSAKIYKYIGGELSPANPMQVAPGSERVDSSKAYWFNVATVGNFTAPVEYELSSSNGLAFGRTLSAMTVGVMNRSTSAMTLTISLEASESAPTGQVGITGGVPLTRRVFNSNTNSYDETPVTGSFTVTVPGSGRINLEFGIDRTAMPGNSSAFYASILRITDSANLSDVRLPVSAQTATTAGLWLCQTSVTNVESTLKDTGSTTSQPFPLIFLIHVDSVGAARMLSQAYVGKLTSAGNPMGICISENQVLGAAVSDIKPHRYVACQLPPSVSFITSSGSVATGAIADWNISIPFDDPANPMVHTYHPDHDNLSPSSSKLQNGAESFSISRFCSFTFTATPPAGSSVHGWGSTILGGTYAETLTGLNSKALRVSGTFAMQRVSEIADIDLTLP